MIQPFKTPLLSLDLTITQPHALGGVAKSSYTDAVSTMRSILLGTRIQSLCQELRPAIATALPWIMQPMSCSSSYYVICVYTRSA